MSAGIAVAEEAVAFALSPAPRYAPLPPYVYASEAREGERYFSELQLLQFADDTCAIRAKQSPFDAWSLDGPTFLAAQAAVRRADFHRALAIAFQAGQGCPADFPLQPPAIGLRDAGRNEKLYPLFRLAPFAEATWSLREVQRSQAC